MSFLSCSDLAYSRGRVQNITENVCHVNNKIKKKKLGDVDGLYCLTFKASLQSTHKEHLPESSPLLKFKKVAYSMGLICHRGLNGITRSSVALKSKVSESVNTKEGAGPVITSKLKSPYL